MGERAQVYCDKCGASFRPIVQEAELADNDGVVEQYFTCPVCGEHYTIALIDDRMRKMIEKRRRIPTEISHMKGMGISTRKLINKDRQLKGDLKKRNSELMHTDQN